MGILAELLEKMDEAIFSATYVDNYIDSVENLPDDVQRHLSRIRDIDVQYRSKYPWTKWIQNHLAYTVVI